MPGDLIVGDVQSQTQLYRQDRVTSFPSGISHMTWDRSGHTYTVAFDLREGLRVGCWEDGRQITDYKACALLVQEAYESRRPWIETLAVPEIQKKREEIIRANATTIIVNTTVAGIVNNGKIDGSSYLNAQAQTTAEADPVVGTQKSVFSRVVDSVRSFFSSTKT